MFQLSALILLIFATVLSCGSAFGADGVSRVNLRSLHFLKAPKDPVTQTEAVFEAEYDRRYQFGRRRNKPWSLQVHPFLYGTSVDSGREQQVTLDPRALYVEYLKSETWLRAGFMTMKWEGTDGLNPMDIASMKDWSDPLNSQTRASAALAIGKSGENYDFELAYIPQQTPALLPGENSAWLPRSSSFPIRSDEFELRLPGRVTYRYQERRELNRAKENNIASRVQLRGDYGDLALAFYEGLADSPAMKPTLNVLPIQTSPTQIFELLNPIEVTPIEYRVRTVAGFYSRALGEWIFRASSRYDQPLGEDPDVPSWSQSTVVGVEKSFALGENTITALVQGAFVSLPKGTSLLSVRDIFNRTVLFGLRYPLGENWMMMLSGFKSTRDSSYFTKFEVSRRLNDHWKIDATGEALGGPPQGLLGVYDANDRVGIGLTGVY